MTPRKSDNARSSILVEGRNLQHIDLTFNQNRQSKTINVLSDGEQDAKCQVPWEGIWEYVLGEENEDDDKFLSQTQLSTMLSLAPSQDDTVLAAMLTRYPRYDKKMRKHKRKQQIASEDQVVNEDNFFEQEDDCSCLTPEDIAAKSDREAPPPIPSPLSKLVDKAQDGSVAPVTVEDIHKQMALEILRLTAIAMWADKKEMRQTVTTLQQAIRKILMCAGQPRKLEENGSSTTDATPVCSPTSSPIDDDFDVENHSLLSDSNDEEEDGTSDVQQANLITDILRETMQSVRRSSLFASSSKGSQSQSVSQFTFREDSLLKYNDGETDVECEDSEVHPKLSAALSQESRKGVVSNKHVASILTTLQKAIVSTASPLNAAYKTNLACENPEANANDQEENSLFYELDPSGKVVVTKAPLLRVLSSLTTSQMGISRAENKESHPLTAAALSASSHSSDKLFATIKEPPQNRLSGRFSAQRSHKETQPEMIVALPASFRSDNLFESLEEPTQQKQMRRSSERRSSVVMSSLTASSQSRKKSFAPIERSTKFEQSRKTQQMTMAPSHSSDDLFASIEEFSHQRHKTSSMPLSRSNNKQKETTAIFPLAVNGAEQEVSSEIAFSSKLPIHNDSPRLRPKESGSQTKQEEMSNVCAPRSAWSKHATDCLKTMPQEPFVKKDAPFVSSVSSSSTSHKKKNAIQSSTKKDTRVVKSPASSSTTGNTSGRVDSLLQIVKSATSSSLSTSTSTSSSIESFVKEDTQILKSPASPFTSTCKKDSLKSMSTQDGLGAASASPSKVSGKKCHIQPLLKKDTRATMDTTSSATMDRLQSAAQKETPLATHPGSSVKMGTKKSSLQSPDKIHTPALNILPPSVRMENSESNFQSSMQSENSLPPPKDSTSRKWRLRSPMMKKKKPGLASSNKTKQKQECLLKEEQQTPTMSERTKHSLAHPMDCDDDAFLKKKADEAKMQQLLSITTKVLGDETVELLSASKSWKDVLSRSTKDGEDGDESSFLASSMPRDGITTSHTQDDAAKLFEHPNITSRVLGDETVELFTTSMSQKDIHSEPTRENECSLLNQNDHSPSGDGIHSAATEDKGATMQKFLSVTTKAFGNGTVELLSPSKSWRDGLPQPSKDGDSFNEQSPNTREFSSFSDDGFNATNAPGESVNPTQLVCITSQVLGDEHVELLSPSQSWKDVVFAQGVDEGGASMESPHAPSSGFRSQETIPEASIDKNRKQQKNSLSVKTPGEIVSEDAIELFHRPSQLVFQPETALKTSVPRPNTATSAMTRATEPKRGLFRRRSLPTHTTKMQMSIPPLKTQNQKQHVDTEAFEVVQENSTAELTMDEVKEPQAKKTQANLQVHIPRTPPNARQNSGTNPKTKMTGRSFRKMANPRKGTVAKDPGKIERNHDSSGKAFTPTFRGVTQKPGRIQEPAIHHHPNEVLRVLEPRSPVSLSKFLVDDVMVHKVGGTPKKSNVEYSPSKMRKQVSFVEMQTHIKHPQQEHLPQSTKSPSKRRNVWAAVSGSFDSASSEDTSFHVLDALAHTEDDAGSWAPAGSSTVFSDGSHSKVSKVSIPVDPFDDFEMKHPWQRRTLHKPTSKKDP